MNSAIRLAASFIINLLLLAGAAEAFAINVHPSLPPVKFPDTEVATNIAISASDNASKDYAFELAFNGSTSNNVEIALGVDKDGDGALSLEEIVLSAGWDCGEWFLMNWATEERFSATGLDGWHELVGSIRLRSDGQLRSISFNEDATPLFPKLTSSANGWTFPTEWNAMRLLGRGQNVRAGERFHVTTSSRGFAIRLQ